MRLFLALLILSIVACESPVEPSRGIEAIHGRFSADVKLAAYDKEGVLRNQWFTIVYVFDTPNRLFSYAVYDEMIKVFSQEGSFLFIRWVEQDTFVVLLHTTIYEGDRRNILQEVTIMIYPFGNYIKVGSNIVFKK